MIGFQSLIVVPFIIVYRHSLAQLDTHSHSWDWDWDHM